MGAVYSTTDHRVCSRCLERFSFLRKPCRCERCSHIFCRACTIAVPRSRRDECHDASLGSGPKQRSALPMWRRPEDPCARLCVACRCPLLSLDTELLRYIMLFLTYKHQDRLLRVCTRFHSVLYLPYEYVKQLESRFTWKDPHDVLHISRRSVVLRCIERHTGLLWALKLVPKSHMLSRRMWQRLQQRIDILFVATRSSSYFAHLYNVLQTRDFVVLVMELLPPERYVSLAALTTKALVASHVPEDADTASGREAARQAEQDGPRGRAAAPLSEAVACAVLRAVLVAVHFLHSKLGVVHRNISMHSILVDRSTCSEVRVVGLGNARFLHLSPKQHQWLQELQVARRLRHDCCSGRQGGLATSPSLQSLSEGGDRSVWTPPRSQPASIPRNSTLEARDGAAVVKVESTRRVPVQPKPPPLPLPFDFALQRKADFYAKVAKDRKAQLEHDTIHSQRFSQRQPRSPTFIHRDLTAGGEVAEPADGGGAAYDPKEEAVTPTLPFGFGVLNVDVAVTPRAADGFAAPELHPVLCAKSVVPTLAISGGDVLKWDTYAIGGLFYNLLSAWVCCTSSQASREIGCAGGPGDYTTVPLLEWHVLSTFLSDRTKTVLLKLTHADPHQRWSCSEALQCCE